MTLEELKIIKEVVDNTNLRGRIWYNKIIEASRILYREIKLKTMNPVTGEDHVSNESGVQVNDNH